MADEGWSCVKDQIIVGREFQRRGQELPRVIRKFKLEGEGQKGVTEVVRGAILSVGLILTSLLHR